jgi:hypothetical protein
MAADHEVDVDVVNRSDGPHAEPRNLPPFMHQEETVHYRSKDDAVRIVFQDLDFSEAHRPFHSPFLDSNGKEVLSISSNDAPIKASNMGIYFCHCFITPPGGKEIGWSKTSPNSGGNHVVKGPGN